MKIIASLLSDKHLTITVQKIMALNFVLDVDECSFDQNFSVRPTSEADVSVIVKAARDADLPISIRRLGVVLVKTFHLTIHNMQTL